MVTDPAILRRKLDELQLVQQALVDNYTACAYRKVIEVTLPGTGAAYSMLIRFDDLNGVARFSVHCYLDKHWKIVSFSRLLDPKMLIDDQGVRWTLREEIR